MNNIDILISEEAIQNRVKELGEQITEDYKGSDLVIITVLKGGFVFTADLVRRIDLPLTIDLMAASSYGAGTESCGEVRILKDINIDIKGKDVLIAEDILDTGNTLSMLKKLFEDRGAKSVKICVALDKPERRTANVEADYIGFVVPNKFLIGYGLDYDEKYRNLPFVGVVNC